MDSDDDLEIVEYMHFLRRPHIYRERPAHFDNYDETDFMARFRLSKDAVMEVLGLIEDRLLTPTDRNEAVTPLTQLLMTLRYYALGTWLTAVGDYCGVSKSTACKIIKRVSRAIASLRPLYISMPGNEIERQAIAQKFYSVARFPRVIGAMDCTHIKIISPGGANAEYFRNRKGFMSVNVQTVSDADLKIRDIVARWPGSTHDQTIFNNSLLRAYFERGDFGTGLLIADSGYENTPFLVTPLHITNNRGENLYNESLVRTRNCVERQYGVWKNRFPILSQGIQLKNMATTLAVIVATAVLHNVCRDRNLPQPPEDPELDLPPVIEDQDEENVPRRGNDHTRRRLINDYFANL